MATKKQKREAALARRAEFEAEVRAEGLRAQAADQARRKVETERKQEEAHKVHLKRNRFHDECERCAKVKAQQAIDRLAKAAAKNREHYTPDANGKHPGVTGNILTVMEPTHQGDNTPIDLTREERTLVNA